LRRVCEDGGVAAQRAVTDKVAQMHDKVHRGVDIIQGRDGSRKLAYGLPVRARDTAGVDLVLLVGILHV